MKKFEVRLATTGQACFKWYSFDTAKEAVKFVLKQLHEVGFTVDGKTYEEKFEEIEWVGKGRIVNV
tara:strand:- start:10184 stop:10381 length:198 start_codon:yes stop_codon:yes gene_type:complete